MNLSSLYSIPLNIKNLISTITSDNRSKLLVVVLIFIFILTLIIIYYKFIKSFLDKKHQINREFVNPSSNDDVVILYFYTQWCPYCKQSLVEIEKFEEYITGLNDENNFTITVSKIDCDENPTMADKYKIQGYPTIKLIYKGKVYNYDAKPNKRNLIEFLETSIS